MNDSEFISLTVNVFNRIDDSFEDIDPDDAEVERTTDNIKIVFRSGVTFIINRQGTAKQIWLATNKQGLHFNYDENSGAWLDSKSGDEFFGTLEKAVSEQLNKSFSII